MKNRICWEYHGCMYIIVYNIMIYTYIVLTGTALPRSMGFSWTILWLLVGKSMPRCAKEMGQHGALPVVGVGR